MRMIRRWLLVPAALLAAACADTRMPTEAAAPGALNDVRPTETAPSPNIVDVVLEINAQTGEFSTLIEALVAADLLDAMASVPQRTVFAPTDAAFAALGLNPGNVGSLPEATLRGLLLFHVTQGRLFAADVLGLDRIQMGNGWYADIRLVDGEPYINNARIVQTDVEATNGVIHVIDAVMIAPAPAPTFVDVLLFANAQTGEFSTLIAAVLAADLAGPLSARGQATVFAPTDAAFAALDLNAGNIGELPKEALINILGYHIAAGRRDAASVVASNQIRMANGQYTQIRVENGEVFINDARIIATDVPASNGIIHVINGVLLP